MGLRPSLEWSQYAIPYLYGSRVHYAIPYLLTYGRCHIYLLTYVSPVDYAIPYLLTYGNSVPIMHYACIAYQALHLPILI